ncbi:carotenoid oxygenase family protein [Streptomyces pseudovenezuelae]|uniref:Dioxygenase n=1 Tax=Streptomyces pseudovenezuelae TaxID=67350 RepID=A0ABT6LTF7_9ACTN|nr:carotenoid oxygenase family protein [Streptomyces pseudovenezuelae]MDH6219591.1 carotenoid cleavage dioxygenase-like enzyme [Streptomyces pseudovenezuelae]
MTKPFPRSPQMSGWEAPQRFEGDIYDLEIEGEVPADLDGSFFRVAPDPQYPPMMGDDIFINGDGSVSAFRIQNGHIDFKMRYVQTPRYLREREARQSLFGLYRNPYTDDPSVAGLSRSTGNTNVVMHNGLLWALKEDSLPIALDPLTLETIGASDFAGQVSSRTFTAHPKFDPETGDMYCFGYEAKGEATDDIAYYVIDPAGKVKHETWFKQPYPGMVHDMAITENYVIFPVAPFTSDAERMRAGGLHWQWEPGLDVVYGVIPRFGGPEDVRWFSGPNAFVGHTLNAFEDRGKIYYDVPLTDGNVFGFFPDAEGRSSAPGELKGAVMRVELDPRRADLRAQGEVLLPTMAEFPAVDERYVSGAYRHVFLMDIDPALLDLSRVPAKPANMMYNRFLHVDAHSGTVRSSWAPGPSATVQEPVFVPRGAGAPEGDGYLIGLVNRLDEVRSDLVVLDTADITAGPVASARLPFRMKNALHGDWAGVEEFRRAS